MHGILQEKDLPRIAFASSTNEYEGRVLHPISYSSQSRWCAVPLSIQTTQWWAFTLTNHEAKINRYYVSSDSSMVPPRSWKLQGFKSNQWIDLSYVPSSDLGNNMSNEYNVTGDHGYFSRFRFISNDLPWNNSHYHFCIYKFDFDGYYKKLLVGTMNCKKLFFFYHIYAFVLLN